MTIEVVALREEHVDDAARLIAANYRVYRKTEPYLPAIWEEESARAADIHRAMAGGPGVAALDGGKLVGFLVFRLTTAGQPSPLAAAPLAPAAAVRSLTPPIDPGRWAVAALPWLAAQPIDRAQIYREMYASLSARLVANGFFEHRVGVRVADSDGLNAWFSLGFGIVTVLGVRAVSPVPNQPGDVAVRRALPDDAAAVCSLLIELERFHATAPIFWPLVPDTQAMHESVEQALRDDDSPTFIASDSHEALGMMRFQPAAAALIGTRAEDGVYIPEAVTAATARLGGVATAILAHGLRWASEAGFERCTVGWSSPNLASSRFWTGKGFEPMQYMLARRIDERVAWANQRLSDDDLSRRW